MNQRKIPMDKPLKDTYKGETIYIYYETFENDGYLLCSYKDDGTGKFKIDKSDFNV